MNVPDVPTQKSYTRVTPLVAPKSKSVSNPPHSLAKVVSKEFRWESISSVVRPTELEILKPLLKVEQGDEGAIRSVVDRVGYWLNHSAWRDMSVVENLLDMGIMDLGVWETSFDSFGLVVPTRAGTTARLVVGGLASTFSISWIWLLRFIPPPWWVLVGGLMALTSYGLLLATGYQTDRKALYNRAAVIRTLARSRGLAEHATKSVQPAAPTQPAAPEPPVWDDRVQGVRDAVTRLNNEWLNYELDIEAYYLTKPLLRDMQVKETRVFRECEARLVDAVDALDGSVTEDKIVEAEKCAENALMAWGDANDHALSIGTSDRSPAERVALRRLSKLTAQFVDPSTPRATLDSLARAIMREMDALTTVKVSADKRKLVELELHKLLALES